MRLFVFAGLVFLSLRGDCMGRAIAERSLSRRERVNKVSLCDFHGN
jgi:hypothetical protein